MGDCFVGLGFVGAVLREHVRCVVSWDVAVPRNPLDRGLYLTPVVEFIGSYQDIGDNRLFVVLALCDGLYSGLGVCEDDDVVD